MWIITSAINAYDQEGHYFVAAFRNKPTLKQIKKLGLGVNPEHLLNGGGRIEYEYQWFFLTEVEDGAKYNKR